MLPTETNKFEAVAARKRKICSNWKLKMNRKLDISIIIYHIFSVSLLLLMFFIIMNYTDELPPGFGKGFRDPLKDEPIIILCFGVIIYIEYTFGLYFKFNKYFVMAAEMLAFFISSKNLAVYFFINRAEVVNTYIWVHVLLVISIVFCFFIELNTELKEHILSLSPQNWFPLSFPNDRYEKNIIRIYRFIVIAGLLLMVKHGFDKI